MPLDTSSLLRTNQDRPASNGVGQRLMGVPAGAPQRQTRATPSSARRPRHRPCIDEGEIESEAGVFTRRETAVLRRFSDGLSCLEMAEELSISIHTVKYHVKNIYRKLGVRRRACAVHVAHSLGLLTPRLESSSGKRPRF